MTQFMTKNHKVIPLSIRKMSDAQLEKIAKEGNEILNRIEGSKGEAFILKNKKLNALAEKVAQVQVTRKNRIVEKIDKEQKEREEAFAKDPDTIALKKLQANPKFQINKEHTVGWIDGKIDFPSYTEGTAFAQNGRDGSGKDSTHRFGHEGEGAFKISRIGDDKLREVLADAKKHKLIFPFATVNDLTIESKVKTAQTADRSVILELGKRSYIIAPRVDN